MTNKVLLINPRLPQRTVRLNVPLSLLFLGTWLSANGYEVNILDAVNYNNDNKFYNRVMEEIGNGVLLVGLSVMTAQIKSAVDIVKYIREESTNYINIVWGGVHPTLYPDQVISIGREWQNYNYADYVVKGEGEYATLKILDAIKSKHMLNSRIVQGDELFDINLLPHPDLSLIEDIRKVNNIKELTKQVGIGLPILSSRGCPHSCNFCVNSVSKIKYRFRSSELVLGDIEHLVKAGATETMFADEDFFANKRRLIEIINGIEDKGLKFRWFGTARADYFRDHHINFELAKRLKESGCQQLGIGVESGSQRVLDMINKGITINDSLHAAELLNKVGIDVSFSYMNGIPDETSSEIEKTLDLVTKISSINNNFRVLGPFIFRPYAGSVLYQRCIELGMQEPESLSEWADSPYLGDELTLEDYDMFPWVQYPIKKLVRLNFYAWMSGLKVRWSWLTKIIRKIGQWRCQRRFFLFPIEMQLVSLSRKFNIDKVMSIGKFS